MSRRLRDTVLLAVLAGASALSAAAILRTGEPVLPAPTPASAPEARGVEGFTLPSVPPVPLEALAEALERPLFTQPRRPPAAPVAAPSPLDATLAGVLTDGAEKLAIVLTAGAERAARLREGDLFRGWRVIEIDDYSVLLERDGRTERLVLTFGGTPPAPN